MTPRPGDVAVVSSARITDSPHGAAVPDLFNAASFRRPRFGAVQRYVKCRRE